MPIITLKLWIENEQKQKNYKHFLNHEDFDIISSKEDEELFAMQAIVKEMRNQPEGE